MEFIPWELLPAWLIGTALIGFGTYQVGTSAMYSLEQAIGAICILVGIGFVFWDIRKRNSRNIDNSAAYRQRSK